KSFSNSAFTFDNNVIVAKKKKPLSRYFENAILVLILLSSILLGIDNPLKDPRSTFARAVYYIDTVFTFLFLLEAIIKIIAMGFLFSCLKDTSAYIRNMWNLLDFGVVIASLVDFYFSLMGMQSGK